MPSLEAYAKEQISALIPAADCLELKAAVSDSSYSIEFFVQIGGERKQCCELADDGIVDEDKLDQVLALIAERIRSDADYKKGTVNKVSF